MYRRVFLLILFLSVTTAGDRLVAPAMADEPSFEIKLSDTATSSEEAFRREFQLLSRQVALYDQHSQDPPATKKIVRQYLRHMAANHSGIGHHQEPLVLEDQPLFELAEQALATGSDDPLFLAYHVDTLIRQGELGEAKNYAETAIDFFPNDYPPGVEATLRFFRQLALRRAGDVNGSNFEFRELVKSLPAFFEWATQQPNMQQPAWRELIRFSNNIRFPGYDAERAVKKYEQSDKKDPWLAAMFRGWFHFRLASEARRGRQVTGLGDARENNLEAGKFFRKAWELRPDIVESSYMMMAVSRQGGDEDDEFTWFQRAIDAQFDFIPAYESVLFSLRPRWGGSHKQMLAFGDACVATGRFDTQIPYVYIEAMHDIRDEGASWSSIEKIDPDHYETYQKVLWNLANDPGHDISKHLEHGRLSRGQKTWLTFAMAHAMRFRKFDEARKISEMLGDEINEQLAATNGLRSEFDQARLEAVRSQGDQLKAAWESRFPPHSPEQSQQVFDTYTKLAKSNNNDKAAYFYDAIISQAKKEIQYQAGEWVDLTFGPDLAQWDGNVEVFRRVDEKTVAGDNRASGRWMYLYHKGYFPGPKEMQFDMDLKEHASRWFFMGAHLGYCYKRGHATIRPDGRMFLLETDFPQAGIGVEGVLPKQTPIRVDAPYHVHVKVWDEDRYEFTINDVKIEVENPQYGFTMSSNSVGIGTSGYMLDVGVVEFKNVRIRQLQDATADDE